MPHWPSGDGWGGGCTGAGHRKRSDDLHKHWDKDKQTAAAGVAGQAGVGAGVAGVGAALSKQK